MKSPPLIDGFTLIELLTALLILSLLALLSYRSLGATLEARSHISVETIKWQRVASFSARFEQDIRMVLPQTMRNGAGSTPVWLGRSNTTPGLRLEFNRFASIDGSDTPRRVGYGLNEKQEIELWLWPGLEIEPDRLPARYRLLSNVAIFEFQYLTAALAWVNAWPLTQGDTTIPRAVRLRILLASGEEIIRVFSLNS
jgi:general secretion pathway protein J